MNQSIFCFLPAANEADLQRSLKALRNEPLIEHICVVNTTGQALSLPHEISSFEAPSFQSSVAIKEMARLSGDAARVMLYTKSMPLKPGEYAMHRFVQALNWSGAGMVYSDYYELKGGELTAHPVIDYQEGSLRDDFNFGSLLLFNGDAFRGAARKMSADFKFAGLYDLRLRVSQGHRLVRLPELLYTEVESDTRHSGQKIFDYVDPKNREVQIEMEQACTAHLKEIGGWLKPEFKEVAFDSAPFPVEASVVIPVRNRVKTIRDAVDSVLSQETSFPFNLIVVDNHSTDGTTGLLQQLAGKDERLIHVIPGRHDLGIGGCWNHAVMHLQCGKFAIQLDSDDIYADNLVLQTIVDAFYGQNCAMVVGAYQMVNFNLEEIPPGLIDHREWTPQNGRNNALRINGLGAPRAFYTPVLREILVPNVSYGEDYALGLSISRHYQIGRIYKPLYLCRRWDDNTDASLDIAKMNAHNLYKDRIRTLELWARIALNKEKN